MSATVLTNSEAREIAALWQSPGVQGIGFAMFASTGTITDALLEDIDREIESMERETGDAERMTDVASNLVELRALLAYVNEQNVLVWSVYHNHAGYLPESDGFLTLTYADAVTAYIDELLEAPEALCGDEECDGTPDGETCEVCTMDAHVRAYIADEVPSVIGGRVFGEQRTMALALRSESAGLPTVYSLDSVWLPVSEYREAIADM
jgi:hypothetical protein